MIHQRWLLALFTALFVWMPTLANAQDAEERATPTEKRVIRHQPIQLPRDSSFNPDDILQRFQQAHDQTELQRLAEQLLKNPSFQKMLQNKLEEFKASGVTEPNSTQIQEKLKETLRKELEKGTIKLPEQSEHPAIPDEKQLEKLLKETLPEPNPAEPDIRADAAARPSPTSAAQPPAPVQPANPSTNSESNVSNQPEADSGISKELVEYVAEKLENLDPSFTNSPALQRALQDLNRATQVPQQHWPGLDSAKDRLRSKLPDWNSLKRWRPEGGWPLTHALDGAKMPRMNLSNRWLSGLPRPNVRLPSLSTPDVRGGGHWSMILGGLGLLLLAFVGWRLLAIRRAHDVRTGKAGWRLGSWPTNPAHVTTRADLIRAFEYVSLLRLGPNARHWNHREIAAGLGVENDRPYPERREAAEQVAAVYEQARYAPPEEALSDIDLAAARRNLCFLAGVSAA